MLDFRTLCRADKRKLTDNNEQVRLFQQSGFLYVDEMVIPNSLGRHWA
ncbi:MAG: hypothetical protein GX801_03370 [Fibrobacter sp.]|nr:hypothetical protein [Fibrobacter sp.]